VSLFAQELKTPYPVSFKRLDKLWAEISRSLDTEDTKDSIQRFNHQGEQVILHPSAFILALLEPPRRQGRQGIQDLNDVPLHPRALILRASA
jgi:hypothetical protein